MARRVMTRDQRLERDRLRKRLEYRQRKIEKIQKPLEAELTTKAGLIRTVEFSRSIRGLSNRDIRAKITELKKVDTPNFLKNEFNATKRAYLAELASSQPAIAKSTLKFTKNWTWREWQQYLQSDRFVSVSQLDSNQIQQHFDLIDEIKISKLKPSTQARMKREKARKTLTKDEEAMFMKKLGL